MSDDEASIGTTPCRQSRSRFLAILLLSILSFLASKMLDTRLTIGVFQLNIFDNQLVIPDVV